MKKKKSVAKMFFLSLLKSLLCIVIIIGVGVISYKVSYTILSNGKSDKNGTANELKEILEEATTDEISKNLIYVYDEHDKITHVMLEICNSKTNNMDYITIPTRTDYTIPTVMYRKLCTVNEEIPQVIRVSKLKQYFSDDNDAYGYGMLIFEKMLATDISYFTAIDEETYKSHYQTQKVTVSYKKKNTDAQSSDGASTEQTSAGYIEKRVSMNLSVVSDAFARQLKDIAGSKEKIASYIKEQYERVASNLTVYNKIGYVDAYRNMNVDYYHYWGIPGCYTDKIFSVDRKAAKSAIAALVNNTSPYAGPEDLNTVNKIAASYTAGDDSSSSSAKSTENTAAKGTDSTTAQSQTNTAGSKGLNIYVLNGSQITGLASKTKNKLVNAGYTVPRIGNYQAETLTQTVIKVSRAGQGEDLKQYFNNPRLTVGGVTTGYDIEIILGTADAN